MILNSITLTNFRNYSKASFDFNGNNILILGPNASGKSNLLEAIHSLSGTGFVRAHLIEEEIINQASDFCRIKGVINNQQEKILEMFLQIPLRPAVFKKRRDFGGHAPKKVYWINGVQKAKKDFLGNFFSTLFLPDDLQLVSGAPSLRRKFLDNFLSNLNKNYYNNLLSFQRVLRQRNRVLWQIREKNKTSNNLDFWNEKFFQYGKFLQKKRSDLIKFLGDKIIEMGEVFDSPFNLSLKYKISDFNEENLTKIRDREIRFAQSLVGPQRDDLCFYDNDRDLTLFGSRAEQRTAVFLLKMAENRTLETKLNTKPVLLLDDIFSELDERKRQVVLELSKKQQTIVTTSDRRLAGELESKFETIELG